MRGYDSFADLLHFFLHNSHPFIIVIVCSKKERFLEEALDSMSLPSQERELGQTVNEDDTFEEQEVHERPNNLLEPTLRSIAQAGKTRILYCTNIDSLRAHLSVLSSSHQTIQQARSLEVTSILRPLLLILDAVLLHHGTSEFSVQGLSRTFAVAVEGAARENMDLIFSELKDVYNPENHNRGPRLWQAQVPLLSESVKIGPEAGSWTRRIVSVQRLAERWIKFPHCVQSPEQTSNTWPDS